MNKKTKMWLGVGVVAAAAYYFWHKSQSTTSPAKAFANYGGGYHGSHSVAVQSASRRKRADGVFANMAGCPAGFTYSINSNNVPVCDNGKGWRYKTSPIR